MLCKVIKDNKNNELWAGSATITPATDSATAPVTTLDARQSGGKLAALQAKVLLLFAEVQIIYYQSKEIL